MNYPKYDPIVDFKVNYESFDEIDASMSKIESRIPASSMVRKINFYNCKKLQKVNKTQFNLQVSLIIPEEKVVVEIQDLIKECRYFIINDFQLCDIFHKKFLDLFIKNGKLECVSHDNAHDDRKILIERNILHLTVSRDLCHQQPIVELIQFRCKEDDEFSGKLTLMTSNFPNFL